MNIFTVRAAVTNEQQAGNCFVVSEETYQSGFIILQEKRRKTLCHMHQGAEVTEAEAMEEVITAATGATEAAEAGARQGHVIQEDRTEMPTGIRTITEGAPNVLYTVQNARNR